jgi:peroxiredoxin (alkyl hydroperoxide reductase subunit C)
VQGYRDALAKFRDANTQVLGISVDSPFAQKEFAKQHGVTFPLLSDLKHTVSRAYGVFNEERGTANRATFVVDTEGRIKSIEVGNSAIDVSGALSSCQSLK